MSNITLSRCTSRTLLRCVRDFWIALDHQSTVAAAQQQCPHFMPKETLDGPCPMTDNVEAPRSIFDGTATNFSNKKSFDSIPTPKGLPFVGTVFDVIRNGGPGKIHRYCDKRHKELGPIYREKLGSTEAVFIADSQLIQTVYQNEGKYPVHLIPEPWIMYNEMTGDKRGLFFM